MPRLKADRAINLLLAVGLDIGERDITGKDVCQREFSAVVESCWQQLLLYVASRTLMPSGSEDVSIVLFLISLWSVYKVRIVIVIYELGLYHFYKQQYSLRLII